MLVSLLLDREGNLLAGAWACDQIPFGRSFWSEFLGLVDVPTGYETAVVALSDRNLVDEILAFHLEPSSEQLSSIMSRLEQPLQDRRRVVVGRFAA